MWHYEIGEIIISKEGFRKPERYQDIIIILGENGIMPKEFSKKFSLAAGLRNILVHRYTEIDIEEILNHIKEDLDNFKIFSKHVAKYLKKQ